MGRGPMTVPVLWHLTLSTLHGRPSPRSETGDDTLELLRPVLHEAKASGAPAALLEGEPYTVRIVQAGDGWTAFAIAARGEALVTCAAYWTLAGEGAALGFMFKARGVPGPGEPDGEIDVRSSLAHETALAGGETPRPCAREGAKMEDSPRIPATRAGKNLTTPALR